MSVLDQAQNFSGGVISAARQRDRWARQEANATDEETREQYREAIADLGARFPDLEDVPIGGAEAFARERGHGSGSRSPVHEGRRRVAARGGGRSSKGTAGDAGGLGGDSAAAKGKPKEKPGLSAGAKRKAGGSRRRAGATPRVDRALRQTGIPTAAASSGSALLAALGATVGLAFGYLVLTSAETPGAGAGRVTHLLEDVAPKALGRFLNPYADVFPSPGAQAPAGGTPTYNEGPGSKISIAASRLQAAGRLPKQPPTAEQRRERRHPRALGRMHR